MRNALLSNYRQVLRSTYNLGWMESDLESVSGS